MAYENHTQKAQAEYELLCQTLEEIGWSYTKSDEQMLVEVRVQGENLPMTLQFGVDPERQIVRLYSFMPFTVPEEKRLEMAYIVCHVNYRLVDGCFDFSLDNGSMLYRISNSFIDSTIGKEVFKYMIDFACDLTDLYNDKFFMYVKDMVTIDQLFEKL